VAASQRSHKTGPQGVAPQPAGTSVHSLRFPAPQSCGCARCGARSPIALAEGRKEADRLKLEHFGHSGEATLPAMNDHGRVAFDDWTYTNSRRLAHIYGDRRLTTCASTLRSSTQRHITWLLFTATPVSKCCSRLCALYNRPVSFKQSQRTLASAARLSFLLDKAFGNRFLDSQSSSGSV